MKSRLSLLLITVFLATFNLKAQNWERLYDRGNANDLLETPDGGFILAGSYDAPGSASKTSIIKTDAEGNVEWSHRHAVGDTMEYYTALQILDPQHIIAVGDYMIYFDHPERFVPFIQKLDAQGNVVGQLKLDPTPVVNRDYKASDVALTASGVVLMSLNLSPAPQSLIPGRIYAYDSNLTALWSAEIPEYINQMIPLPDGTTLLSGGQSGLMSLCKIDAAGAMLWQKTYESGMACATLTQDGNIILTSNGKMIKVDPEGQVLWSKNGVAGFQQNSAWVTEDQSGNILVIGTLNANFSLKFTLSKFDPDGNLIWKKIPHESLLSTDSNAKPLVTSDGGYALAGSRASRVMLMRSDPDFNIYRSWIAGHMFHDLNDDCIEDPDEGPLSRFIVMAIDNFGSTWAEMVQNGKYAMQVPPGEYQVAVLRRANDPEYWEACPAQTAIVTPATDTTHLPALGIKSLVDCPRPSIRAGIAKVRQCHDNKYNLQYYNLGTQKATDVKIEVTLPDFLSYTGCSLPLLSQNGQVLTFAAGDLDINEGGTASLDVFCACDVALGDVACTTFRITPDTCYPTLASWDQSIISIKAEYNPDNVWFTLKNVGAGDMASARNYMLRSYCISVLDQGSFQLESGESQTITRPNNALAYLFEAEQPGNQPYIPGNTASLWRCQTDAFQEAWWHSATGTPFYAFNCENVKNSFDPNDMTVTPRGDGDEHFILATEPELNYRIRFQNTGNDTAFVVSIRDTLPAETDIVSVIPGPSSHPYSFDIQHNTIKFLFQNIDLPDSSSNMEGSQGFVSFTVKMKPQLTAGTRIDNRAAIYFDLNKPILTNTAFNIIHEPVLVSVDVSEIEKKEAGIRVSPNPATDMAVFQFESPAEGVFYLLDVNGRTIDLKTFSGSEFRFGCQQLPQGVYFFKFLIPGKQPFQGKLAVSR